MMDVQAELEKIQTGATGASQPSRPLIPYLTTAAALCEEDIPPRKFLLGCWMPMDSFGMVFAPRGIGKTWFAMALAVAIAGGRKSFLGWKVHEQCGVLYIDGEMAKVDLRDRFASLMDEPLDNLHILSSETLYRDGCPICLDELPEQKAVEEALEHLEKKGEKVQLIILDNLSTLRRGVDENSNGDTQQLVDWLVSLRHRGYTVLVVHHTNKAGQQRGASIIEVPMDYILKLDKPENNPTSMEQGANFDLSFEKVRARRPDPDKLNVSLRENNYGQLELAHSESSKAIARKYWLLRFIAENRRCPYRQIAKKMGISASSITNYMAELRKEGLIQPGQNWGLTQKGEYEISFWWPSFFAPPRDFKPVQQREIPF